jgi:hypothetical protein
MTQTHADPVLSYVAPAQRAAARWHVPVAVLLGLISVETGGNANAVSAAGAQGSTQFMPGTAKGYGVKFGSSPAAIETQVDGAAHYLHDLGYAHDPRGALAKYNGGPGNPQYGYAAQVLQHASKYGHAPAATSSSAGTSPPSDGTLPGGSSEWSGGLLSPLFGSAAKGLIYLVLIAGGALLLGLGTRRALSDGT